MKKIALFACVALMGLSAKGQTFQKGDRVVNAGIGVGVIKGVGPTFTQKIGMEWGVAHVGPGVIGLGVALHNAYGGTSDGEVAGAYDYKVPTTMHTYRKNDHNRWMLSTDAGQPLHRVGYGTADAKFAREDLKAMVTGSYHYAITDKLEAYGTFGMGVALINNLCGHFDNYKGFERKTKQNDINTSNKTTQYCLTYSYDDLDHADFEGYRSHKAGFACGVCAGARYAMTESISAFGEVGLVSGAFNKNQLKGLDVLTLGVSIKL